MNIAAYNYNAYQFTSTIPLDADYCEVRLALGDEPYYILKPDVIGQFTFDTYEFSRHIFEHYDSFLYDATFTDTNQFREVTFYLNIVNLDGSTEQQTFTPTFFNGTKQRWEDRFVTDGVINLSELRMPYWNGYPFDYSSVVNGEVVRTLVDNGLGGGSDPNVRVINPICKGYYLKWHNSSYGYSYYLFSGVGKERFAPKSIGTIRENFTWTDNYLEIGKVGQRELSIMTNVPYEDRELMKSLSKSDQVYLYTLDQFQAASSNSWLPVQIDMTVKESNRYNSFEQVVKIYLPEEQTVKRL